jgi:hypothetical protein
MTRKVLSKKPAMPLGLFQAGLMAISSGSKTLLRIEAKRPALGGAMSGKDEFTCAEFLHGPQVKNDYEAILKPVAETSDESNIT